MSANAKPGQVVRCLQLLADGESVAKLVKNAPAYRSVLTMLEVKTRQPITANVVELGIIDAGMKALIGS